MYEKGVNKPNGIKKIIKQMDSKKIKINFPPINIKTALLDIKSAYIINIFPKSLPKIAVKTPIGLEFLLLKLKIKKSKKTNHSEERLNDNIKGNIICCAKIFARNSSDLQSMVLNNTLKVRKALPDSTGKFMVIQYPLIKKSKSTQLILLNMENIRNEIDFADKIREIEEIYKIFRKSLKKIADAGL